VIVFDDSLLGWPATSLLAVTDNDNSCTLEHRPTKIPYLCLACSMCAENEYFYRVLQNISARVDIKKYVHFSTLWTCARLHFYAASSRSDSASSSSLSMLTCIAPSTSYWPLFIKASYFSTVIAGSFKRIGFLSPRTAAAST
jgi:hypothetical protein